MEKNEFKYQYKQNLKSLRQDHAMTQAEVAQLIGTTQQQYSRYEKGSSEIPTRVLATLAEHFGLTTDYLLGISYSRDGADMQNEALTSDHTIGLLISNVLALSEEGRAEIMKYIDLHLLKESFEKGKKKPR